MIRAQSGENQSERRIHELGRPEELCPIRLPGVDGRKEVVGVPHQDAQEPGNRAVSEDHIQRQHGPGQVQGLRERTAIFFE